VFVKAHFSAPVEMLGSLFEAHGWSFEYVNDDEVCAEIPGSWTTYQLRGVFRSDDRVLQLLCLPEVRVPAAKRRAAHELLAMINEQLWLGHFDIWSQGGVLLYRHGLMLGDDGRLSLTVAQARWKTRSTNATGSIPRSSSCCGATRARARRSKRRWWTRRAKPDIGLTMFESILLVGCGNMAGAMLEGWLAAGLIIGCGNMGGSMLAGWLARERIRRALPCSIPVWPKRPQAWRSIAMRAWCRHA
jgi:hypothetical protein